MEDELHSTLLRSLEDVRKMFDAGADDWEYALLRTMARYCQARGVEPRLIAPIDIMLARKTDKISRQRGDLAGKPLDETLCLTAAAAAVTALKRKGECSSVAEAARVVARVVGVDQKTITEFRNRISRGTAPDAATAAYRGYVAEILTWPDISSLQGICRFVS